MCKRREIKRSKSEFKMCIIFLARCIEKLMDINRLEFMKQSII